MTAVKISELPAATAVNTGDLLAIVQGGATKQADASLITSGATAWEAPGSQPLTLATGAEVTLTHSEITNEMYDILVRRNTGQAGLTNVAIDYDVADAGNYSYSLTDVEFVGGVAQLKATSGAALPSGATAFFPLVNSISEQLGASTNLVGTAAYGSSVNGATAAALSSTFAITAPASLANIGTGNFTVAAWIKFGAGLSANTPIFGGGSGGDYSWYISAGFGNGSWHIWDGGSQGDFGLGGLTLAEMQANWHHYAFVRTSGSIKFYVDGVLKNTITFSGSLVPSNTTIQLGRDQGSGAGTNPFAGWMQQLLISKNTALFTADFTPPNYLRSYPVGWLSGGLSTVCTGQALELDLADVSTVNTVEVTASEPSGTQVKMAFTTDGGTTWWTNNGDTTEEVDLVTSDKSTWGDIADVCAALAGLTPTTETRLGFCFALTTNDAATTPNVSGISINYDEPYRYDPAVVGSYTSTAEFGVQRQTPTTTKIKNLTNATQRFFAHFIIP